MTNHTEEPTNVLIVDDLPDKILAYRTILDELGLNLITANSGEEALRAVLQHDFAVILLDVQMPGMDGLETASLIHRRKRSAHTPIIFLTAFADEVRVAEGYAQGAVDYITTPVIPAVLRAKVRVFADMHRMTQQVRRQAEERVALIEERTRREAAEESNRWLDFLTSAGGVLWQSLDQSVTMRSVAKLPIPHLGDVSALLTLSPSRAVDRCLIVRGEADVSAVESSEGLNALGETVVQAVTRARADDRTQLIDGRTLALPLRARGQTFAILAINRGPDRKPFELAQVTVAETFASRAASALENARLYREVQEANRQKNEFLSMLAHELRNPLAPIRNANEILRQKATEPDKVRWAQGVIDRQASHLVRLVDDLLDVSRLTLGKISLMCEPLGLERVIAHAVEAAQPLIDQFGHTLEVELPAESIRVSGDEARLMQVLINLLNNAAKYTESGGRIWLTLCREQDEAVVRVRDTGVGIPPELLPTVFDLFTQSSRSLDRSQGGLGVGLSLVKQLIEMHGGSVAASSEGAGCGSEFVVRLPALPDAKAKPARDSLNGESHKLNGSARDKLRVMVVDDLEDGGASQANFIGILGHDVAVAGDSAAALELASHFHPDVVLLEIGLPGLDVFAVAGRLQRELKRKPILVAVSAFDDDRRRTREAGFEHHFLKPIRLEALRELLESIRAIHHV
jgi:signal transduction histidine kinase/DNA-binding response OmpR family regulator